MSYELTVDGRIRKTNRKWRSTGTLRFSVGIFMSKDGHFDLK